MKESIAIGCTGGKAPGWPAGIKGVTDAAEEAGLRVVALENGCEAMVQPDAIYKDIHDFGDQSTFMESNESPIYASRFTPFNKKKLKVETDQERDRRALLEFNKSEEKRIIMDNMRVNRVKAVILLGGDDSIWTLQMLMKAGALEGNVATKTIDNDVTNTLSHGHITAGAVGRQMVDGIRIEARSYNRVGVVEAMGRNAGHLAQQHYNADIILPAKDFHPNHEVTRAQITERIQEVFAERGRKERGDPNKGNAVIVVPEGFLIDGEETFLSTKEDPHEHKRLGGVGHRIQEWLEGVGLGTVYQRPGYMYRFANPTQQDAELTYNFGKLAAEEAIKGNTGLATVAQGPSLDISTMDLHDLGGGKFMRPEDYNFDELMPKTNDLRAE
ncbi:MAG: 6-phosphofructokinase [Kiritimatiellales bacterium]|nr:6-phosphofructokinase [Kiritimatiellales bacterium]